MISWERLSFKLEWLLRSSLFLYEDLMYSMEYHYKLFYMWHKYPQPGDFLCAKSKSVYQNRSKIGKRPVTNFCLKAGRSQPAALYLCS